jgi:hypothetical protein
MTDEAAERLRIYESFVNTGGPPAPSPLWPALAADRWIVLDTAGDLLMAHPFSARPTAFPVISEGRRWYANCIWDALAIPAMLQVDAEIPARCAQSGVDLPIRIRSQRVEAPECLVHFAVPLRQWWADIVFT